MKRVVVLVSGSGTLLQALLDADAAGALDGVVVGVVSDRPDAYGLVRAQAAGVATAVVPLGRGDDRAAWDVELARVIAGFEPDLVVGAGFMRLLGPAVLSRFPGRIVNSHPALLPSFPGAHGVRDALAYGVRVSGASVFVVDEGVDTGRILAQEPVRVLPDDTEDSLHERIKAVERPLLVGVVRDWSDVVRPQNEQMEGDQ